MNLCDENRIITIEKAKQALIKGTNIEDSPEEIKVLDNILFRCWQMGWLDRYDPQKKQPITEDKIKAWLDMWKGYIDADIIARMKYRVIDIRNVQLSQAATDINVGHKAAGHGSNVPMQPNIPPMPSNTSNALKALNSVNATRFDALDALADAYKGRSNALENQTKWNRMMLHLADLQLTYSPDWGANGQGDQKLYDFVTELIDEFSGWDVPDTNVGEMITKQQVIDVLKRVKRTASDILYDGPVLMSYNDVLNSLINIVNLMPAVQQKIIHCKDCKHFKSVFAPNDNDGLCGHWHSKCDARTSREGYCSHAERKQNDTERC